MVGVPVLKLLRQWPIGVQAPPPMNEFVTGNIFGRDFGNCSIFWVVRPRW